MPSLNCHHFDIDIVTVDVLSCGIFFAVLLWLDWPSLRPDIASPQLMGQKENSLSLHDEFSIPVI